jgi:WD40 repeat protein
MGALGELVSSTTTPFWVNVVSWGPGGQWIAAGGGSSGTGVSPGGLAVIDAASGATRWQMASEWPVSDIMVSPDGRWLAVAEFSWDKSRTSPMQGLARVISTNQGAERCRGPADHLASTVVFSPDSSCVAATVLSDEDGDPQRAWVFDATIGTVRCELAGHNILGLAFSPDSKWVAAACTDGPVVVFDAATGTERPRLDNLRASGVRAVAFSPDGQWVAAAGGDSTVRLIEAGTGRQVWMAVVDAQVGPACSVAFSADGQWLTAITPDVTEVFRVADGSPRFAQPTQVTGDTVTFSPTLRHVAVSAGAWGSDQPRPALTVLDAGKGTVTWQATLGSVLSPPGYSDDGRLIAVGLGSAGDGAHGGLVNVYDTAAEQARRTFGGPVTWVTANQTGIRLAATASTDQKATIFHADTGDLLLERVHPGAVIAIEFSPDGQFFATGSTDTNARLFQTVSGVPAWKIAHGGPVNAVAVSSDGKWVATGSGDRIARVLGSDAGALRCQHQQDGSVTAVVFSPDTQLLATGSADRTTRILSAVSGDELHRYVHDGKVRAVAFSPSGALLATGNEDGTVLVIDSATGQQRGEIVHTSAVAAVAISPDGQLIATGGADRTVRLSSLGSGAPGPALVLTYDAPITALAFSPADRLLAVVTGNPVVRVIDPGTGAEAYRLIHPAAVHAVAFTGDGELIVTACHDAIARVFPAKLP